MNKKEAIEKYGEEVGLIYMVGYMQGKIYGFQEAMKEHANFDPINFWKKK